MLIRKTQQPSDFPENSIHDTYNESTSDTYSCNYVNSLLNTLYPIGKVEIFFDNDDHSNHLGFTWERTSIGRFPIGIGTNTDFNGDTNTYAVGAKGGAYRHTLGLAEMPSHSHSDGVDGTNGIYATSGGSSAVVYWSNNGGRGTGYTGGGQPHNNIPPYEAMAFWKRIS